jgi:DNA polymerase-1
MKLIVDCNGLGYRYLFGLSDLSHGVSKTGVIFGFLSSLLELAEKFKTDQFVFCWDSRQSYRKLIEPGYKNRPVDPEKKELVESGLNQFALLRKEILPAMGFRNIFMQTGYEADDLIAWTINRCPDSYMIVTGDSDLLQLLREHHLYPVRIWNFRTKAIISVIDFRNKYGLEPWQWSRVKAIGGCQTDDVPGISGVAEKTAIQYLNGSLKEGKIKARIESEEGKATIARCWNLVALPFAGDRPITITGESMVDNEKFYSLDFMDVFRQYGMGSFSEHSAFEKWRKCFNLLPGRA